MTSNPSCKRVYAVIIPETPEPIIATVPAGLPVNFEVIWRARKRKMEMRKAGVDRKSVRTLGNPLATCSRGRRANMELEWKDWDVEAPRASKAHDHHRAYQLSSIASGRL